MQKEFADEEFAPAGGEDDAPVAARRFRWRWLALGFAIVLGMFLAAGWFSRDRIAENIISSQLEKLGIPGRYTVESITPRKQVLTQLVLGDPERPDFTTERVEIQLVPHFGLPGIRRVRLVKPRLYGTYRDGQLSFGSLDPLIFTDSKEPFSLPDMTLAIDDGRALIDSEYGAMGLMVRGSGPLRGGFSGEIAGTAPLVEAGDCVAKNATIYGRIAVRARKPGFSGPLRLGSLTCSDSNLRLARVEAQATVTAAESLTRGEARVSLKAGALSAGANRIAASSGTAHVAWRGEGLTARYDLAGKGLSNSQARAGRLAVKGRVRALRGFSRLDVEGDVKGKDVRLGAAPDSALASAVAAGEGTLVGDLATTIRQALAREGRSSSLSGTFILRRRGERLGLVVPSAMLRGSSGESLLTLSRIQASSRSGGVPVLTGNFATGGRGLPRINGRMEQSPGGRLAMRISMAEYRAQSARAEIPQLYVAQDPGGAFGFSGEARLSGALPGGGAENLAIPVAGNWSPRAGLGLWPKCVTLRFDKLELAGFAFERRGVPLCPARGGAIVRSGASGLKVAGGLPGLDLTGHVGETPATLASGAIGFAWPGNLEARDIRVTIGPEEARSVFLVPHVAARLSDGISGTFEHADVRLDAVPLDMRDIAGTWSFQGGVLSLADGTLRVEDREQVDRFEPLIARDATLRLAENDITAEALMREPGSDREVVRALIEHDLSTGRGHADLLADGVLFDERMQPDTVSHLALGVIANAKGVVRGKGRIDWNEDEVTSSGRFSTQDMDFAAAFGPVEGVSGSVTFTDLLGLVTKPDQRLRIASINPGIEVNDGVLSFEMRPGEVLHVGGADWPFQGGTLHLEPVDIPIGTDEPLRYVLTIKGLDAALFLQHLDLGNLDASGLFDGSLPLVFDKNGGRIEKGFLVSRPPGGNVSYVGQLTYKDLSAIANFAFDALKSIDYRQMRLDLDGSLEGELVTRVTFDGISQGEKASKNFLTRRVAKLPIQFRVNVRAPFMQLVTSMRSLYDPTYLRDPRTLGLVDPSGRPTLPLAPDSVPSGAPPAIGQAEPSIQPSESDQMQ